MGMGSIGSAIPNAIQQTGQATGTGGKGGVSAPMPDSTMSDAFPVSTPPVGAVGKGGMPAQGTVGATSPGMPMVPSAQLQQLLQTLNGGAPTATTPMPGQVGKGGAPLGSSPTPMPTPGMGGKGSMPLGPTDAPIGMGGKGGKPSNPKFGPIVDPIRPGVGGKGGFPQKPNQPFGMHPGFKGGSPYDVPFRPGQPGPIPNAGPYRPTPFPGTGGDIPGNPSLNTPTYTGGLNNLTPDMLKAMQ